jgi:ferredoxin, 2Fe-2S
MPKIVFLCKNGASQTIEAENNWSIMQIAVEHNIEGIEGACGGSMACATCHIYVHPEWLRKVEAQDNEQSEEEKDILDTAYDVRRTSRLGCQIKLNETLDSLVVALPGTDTDW